MSFRSGDQSTYYEILEVAPTASGSDIHAAYMKAKQTYSPESPALYTMFTPDEARELLKMIDEAFSTLSNQAKRAEYDLGLARRGHPSFQALLQREGTSRASGTEASTGTKPAALKAVPSNEKKLMGEEGAVLKGMRPLNQKDELPEGFARSRFGVYEINPRLEEEILRVQECDGGFIQKVRTYKKVSLDQLSDSTKISKSYLAAIESNAFEALPAPVFVRGFVLQIVRTLGSSERLVDAYMKFFRSRSSK